MLGMARVQEKARGKSYSLWLSSTIHHRGSDITCYKTPLYEIGPMLSTLFRPFVILDYHAPLYIKYIFFNEIYNPNHQCKPSSLQKLISFSNHLLDKIEFIAFVIPKFLGNVKVSKRSLSILNYWFLKETPLYR